MKQNEKIAQAAKRALLTVRGRSEHRRHTLSKASDSTERMIEEKLFEFVTEFELELIRT
jgi:hypothetical protein